MSEKRDERRVLIAVTESSPLSELWRATVEHLGGTPAELVALFVTDDRWRRAASLSFTREILRVGGRSVNFTRERAEQVDRETVTQVRQQFQRLAAEADQRLVFEILPEHEPERIEQLVGVGENVLIAPSHFKSRPIYGEFMRLNCRVLLIEAVETKDREE